MKAYVYEWQLRPRPDISIALRIEAKNVIAARREVLAFLQRHRAAGWEIEAVSRGRERSLAARPSVFASIPLPHAEPELSRLAADLSQGYRQVRQAI